MNRTRFVLALVALGLAGPGALAQGTPQVTPRGKIPVERDMERSERIDQRLGVDDPLEGRSNPPTYPNALPRDPSGVVGFSGEPGIVGNSVSNSGPLPPGGPGNDQ